MDHSRVVRWIRKNALIIDDAAPSHHNIFICTKNGSEKDQLHAPSNKCSLRHTYFLLVLIIVHLLCYLSFIR